MHDGGHTFATIAVSECVLFIASSKVRYAVTDPPMTGSAESLLAQNFS